MALREFLASFREKLQEPILPLHLLNWTLSIFLFSCVANARAVELTPDGSSGKNASVCGFDRDADACSSSTWLGVWGFLFATGLIVVEFQWEKFSAHHRRLYLFMCLLSSVLSFAFFITFCVLASKWGRTDASLKARTSTAAADLGITSAFFSILSWGALAYTSHKGYREDDIGGMERLSGGNFGGSAVGYLDPVTSAYHGANDDDQEPPVP